MTPINTLRIEEINDPASLVRYRLLWRTLLARTPDATFFHTLDWLLVYWKHYGHGQRLRVLIGWDGDRPVGILPLVVRSEKTRAGAVRVLTYPLDDWGTFYGPIGPEPAAMLRAAMEHLRRTSRDWDLLDLRWTDDEGAHAGQTRVAMQSAGFTSHRQAWDRAAVVDLRGAWDDYWQSRTPKWRESIRRYHRRLEAAGRLEFIRYRPGGLGTGDDDPRWDLYEACVQLARSSWQGDSTDGSTLSHPSVAEFLRDAHEAAVRSGSLDLCLLKLDGRPIAFIYNYRRGGRLFGLRMGFDPSAADLGPGKVLQYLMFRDSFARGDSHFDMGVGSLDAKAHWTTSLVTSYRLTCFASATLRTGLLRLKRWYIDRRWGDRYLAGGKTVRQTA
ncbi:MAG TPA: GNAT family N-acetyltransferase [Thermoguttaceae bacterium]|nr:GNAT family N-acetyltransferase [Thermoguttaceae bacterium]